MTRGSLADRYRAYLACLNAQDWDRLHEFVHERVVRNDTALGLAGYREMLIEDFRAIPDLRFVIGGLVCDPPMIAARLRFDCTPVGRLFGLAVNGRRVQFDENVFYAFEGGKIRQVWSIIDRAGLAAQL